MMITATTQQLADDTLNNPPKQNGCNRMKSFRMKRVTVLVTYFFSLPLKPYHGYLYPASIRLLEITFLYYSMNPNKSLLIYFI
jgi:hypothetical protein